MIHTKCSCATRGAAAGCPQSLSVTAAVLERNGYRTVSKLPLANHSSRPAAPPALFRVLASERRDQQKPAKDVIPVLLDEGLIGVLLCLLLVLPLLPALRLGVTRGHVACCSHGLQLLEWAR